MKALVLCGGMPQVELVKELKKRGIYTIIADRNPNVPAVLFADEYCNVSTLDVNGIREVAIQKNIDFVISVCADQMLLVAAQINEELGLPCYIDYQTALNVSNKEYMKRIFVENGIPTSRYLVGNSIDCINLEAMEFPLVVKPVDAYSSRGVLKVENHQELVIAFENAVSISRTNSAIIEEFFGGDEYSVDLYIENGVAFITSICKLDKVTNGKGFVICRGQYPISISEDTINDIRKIAQRIASAFKLVNTPMLIQLKINGGKINIIEFCARTGGGIKYRFIKQVSGFDVIEAVIDLTLGKKPHFVNKQKKTYIINEFIYCKNGKLDHYEGFDELLQNGIINHFFVYKPKGTVFDGIQSSGDRAAYFCVVAKNYDDVLQKHQIANQKVKAIDENGVDLIRHDIISELKKKL